MTRATDSRLWRFDRDQRSGLEGLLAGVDEVGRGPLAGPVVAAAVVFFRSGRLAGLPAVGLAGLNDSKQLTPEAREKLFFPILQHAMVGIGISSEEDIDRLNIYQASRLAMRKAVLALPQTPSRLVIDGNMKLDLPLEQRAIVKGDQKSACIAAASIVAKVYRDAWMCHLDRLYPGYFFYKHKGYSTALHLKALRACGPSPVHRRSFLPVAELEMAHA